MIFVSTKDGMVALVDVGRAVVRFPKGQPSSVVLTLKHPSGHDGSRVVTATGAAWDTALREAVQTMCPALPGTYTLGSGYDSDGEFWTNRAVVVAWAVCADGQVYPVTADGINDGMDDLLAILHPDGTVDVPNDQHFSSFAEWEAREREERKPKAN